jgi:hypothetical protein
VCANYYLASRNTFALTAPAADSASGLASGDVIGFNCIVDKETGAQFWKELDGQYLVDLFYNSQADPVAKNPQEELPIIMSDFRSGFGQDIFDYSDLKRYFSSYGADLSLKDRAILSYGATGITLPAYSALTITNADMETASSGWTNGTRDAAQKHGGSYSYSVAATVAYQDLSWNAKYQNTVIEFTCWIWSNQASKGRISVDDGVGQTDSSYHTGGSSWEEITVRHVMDNAATRIRLELDSTDITVYFDDASLSEEPVSNKVVAHATFNDEEYIGYGNIISKLKSDGTNFDSVYSFPADITSLVPFQVSGTSYLFIFLGTSNAYWYMTTAEAFTESNATDKTYQYAAWVNTTVDTMYANDGANTLRSTVDPLNGGTVWSAQTIVGAAEHNINGLMNRSGALYIPKEDTIYYLDSSGNVQKELAPELEALTNTSSGKNADIWLDKIYYPAGSTSLLEIGATNTWRSPSEFCTNQSAFNGQVFAVTHDDKWLFAILDNSTKVEVLKGRLETVDGSTGWVWHPYQEITLAGCETAFVSSIYQKRLWIASTSASDSLYYIPLPSGYGDVENDTNRSFATTGYFETPFLHGRFKADTKAWIKVTATLGHTYDADIYWECHYKKLQDSSYTDAGDFIGTATDRTHTLYLPVDGSSNNPVSSMMRFKLVGITDDPNKTPVLLNFDARAVMYPTVKDIIWAKIQVAREMLTKDGKVKNKYAKMKACLEKCRDATWPVTMVDIDGVTCYVRFLELPQGLPWREPVSNDKDRDFDYVYNLLLLKMPLS